MPRTACILLGTCLVAACSSLQPEPGEPDRRAAHSGACRADAVQWAVGQPATAEVSGRVWRESHAGLLRPIAPGQAVRQDHRPDRINLEVDRDNVILRAWCG